MVFFGSGGAINHSLDLCSHRTRSEVRTIMSLARSSPWRSARVAAVVAYSNVLKDLGHVSYGYI